ncbi:MAG: hypothetical protein JST82_01370 [Bacteroidetes bacterium]|nr:hypothetical protein [Bacteroidota bacterium]
MIRHLITLLLFASLHVSAQPRLEIGANGGLLKTIVVKQDAQGWFQNPSYHLYDRSTSGINLDLLGNKFTRPFSLSYGVHLMYYTLSSHERVERVIYYPPYLDTTVRDYHYRWLMLALPVGAHYKLAIGRNTALRLSASAGPLFVFETAFGNTEEDIPVRLYTDAAAGIMLHNKFTIGLKFAAISGRMGSYQDRGSYINNYRLFATQADVRMIIPSYKDLKPKTRERIHERRERHTENAIREKQVREKAERDEAAYLATKGYTKKRPYMDVVLGGGAVFPFERLRYRSGVPPGYISHSAGGGMAQVGIDFMAEQSIHRFYLSLGTRIGYMGFTMRDSTGKEGDGTGIHGSFNAGFNFQNHPGDPNRFRVAAIIGGGMRVPANYFGEPFWYGELAFTKYFGSRFGAGINATYYNTLFAITGPNRSRGYDGYYVNAWSINADVRISIRKQKKRR